MAMIPMVIDDIDREILGVLRREGRISYSDLADRVGLGPSATADRVRRLVDAGVITGFRAEVDPAALGLGLRALVELRLQPDADPDAFEASLVEVPEVVRGYHLTGGFDYQLTLALADVARLDDLLRGWKAAGTVLESSTRLILADIDLDPRPG